MIRVFKQIPKALQKQILYRLGYGIAILFLTVILLFYTVELFSILAGIFITIFFVASSFLLFRRAVAGEYVVIRGECLDVTLTAVRKWTKMVIVQTEDKRTIKIMIKQRLKKIRVGSKIMLYVASNMPVYETKGVHILSSYLALEMKGGDEFGQGAGIV